MVNAQDRMVSLHRNASLEPVATMGIHTKSVNKPICSAESSCQARKDADEHSRASGNVGRAGQVHPGHMRWQPTGHQRGGLFYVSEMRQAEGDQRKGAEDPRDVHALLDTCEIEVLSIPVSAVLVHQVRSESLKRL